MNSIGGKGWDVGMAEKMDDEFVNSLYAADPQLTQTALNNAPPQRDGLDFELLDTGEGNQGQTTVAVTSRISLQKFCTTVLHFTELKRKLVHETGFGGMLKLKMIPKLNLKFSAWLMGRVDPDAKTVALDDRRVIRFNSTDMNNVFGLPCFGKPICQTMHDMSPACIEYTRIAESMREKGTHSLKAAESILLKELDDKSSQLEKDCFKIAFVIYAVGYVLCPSSKHDYTTIDYWEALSNLSATHSYNWAEYVLQHLLAAVRKLKVDTTIRHTSIHLVGCHLFLQVLVLDNMDLGTLTRRQLTSPRIALFDADTLRKMVDTLCTNIAGESTFFVTHGLRGDNIGYSSGRPAVQISPEEDMTMPVSIVRQPAESTHAPSISTPRYHSTRRSGPIEFAKHLKDNFGSPEYGEMTLLLKEQNAITMSLLDKYRQEAQDQMYRFAEKILRSKTMAIAMGALSITDAPPNHYQNQQGNQMLTPNVTRPRVLANEFSDAEGSTNRDSMNPSRKRCGDKSNVNSYGSACSSSSGTVSDASRKRIRVEQPDFRCDTDNSFKNTPSKDVIDPSVIVAQGFATEVVNGLKTVYSGKNVPEGVVTFGQAALAPISRQTLTADRFGRDPWSTGSIPAPPSPIALMSILEWVNLAPKSALVRKWVIHTTPRFVCVDGFQITDQLIKAHPMTHEVMCVLMRRFSQIDEASSRDPKGFKFRKFMDTDFATLVLANEDPTKVQSIIEQFMADAASFSVAACRLFFVPVLLHDGWTMYLYDMMKKRIIVLDPQVGPLGYSTQRTKLHEALSRKILKAIFDCIKHFYTNWYCSNDRWTRAFPLIMDADFDSNLSGSCVTFFAKNHDGDKLVSPLNKETLETHRHRCLYDVMHMTGNLSQLPADALETIKTSIHLL